MSTIRRNRRICELAAGGMSMSNIGKRFGISRQRARAIATPLEIRVIRDRTYRRRWQAKYRDAINARRRKKYLLRVRIPQAEAKLARLRAALAAIEGQAP